MEDGLSSEPRADQDAKPKPGCSMSLVNGKGIYVGDDSGLCGVPSSHCPPCPKPLVSESSLLIWFQVVDLVPGCYGNSVHEKRSTSYTHAVVVHMFSMPTIANGYTGYLALLCLLWCGFPCSRS